MTRLIVDGNGLVHKLWWADAYDVPRRFVNTISRIMTAHSVTRTMVAWDAPGPTWRHQLFPGYKSRRPPKPDALMASLHDCRTLPTFRHAMVSGFEADDIIATLARRNPNDDFLILSEDKDLLQLVTPRCRMVNSRGVVTDAAKVQERWGVPPSELRLLLSWMGDTTDGLPGVAGIGPKKAIPHALRGEIGDDMTYELAGLATVPKEMLPSW